MNRSVLARQMFAKGGAAFPDLSGDGKITQKDILMGRGVPMQEGGDPQMAQLQAQADAMGISVQELIARLQNPNMENYIDESGELFYDPNSGAANRKQMFDEAAAIANKYQQPVGMAMGGDPAMAQGVGSMMQAPPMPAEAPMGEQAIDPQVLEGLLGEASQSIGNLDEAEDYATVMNSIRGDDASIEERYAELADVVGPEDAQQTPESVLTLVQPAMAMAAVDQGIGGLAAEEMTEPVQGAMAQGIMSTMAPPPPPAAPPMAPPMMGGPPPVNFNQGGLVRRGDNQPVQMFSDGGMTAADMAGMIGYQSLRLNPAFLAAARRDVGTIPTTPDPEPTYDERVLDAARGAEARYVKAGLGSAESRAAELEEQKNLTQAQMLFDVANTALAFAAPMEGERAGMSPAERLAMAARTTQLPQTIGARAQQQLEAKKAAGKEERALKLAAVQRGETQVDKEIAAADALALVRAKPKKASFINVLDKTGTKSLGSYDISTTAGAKAVEKLVSENEGAFPTTNMPREPKEKDVVLYDNKTGAQSPIFNKNSPEGKAAMAAWRKANPLKDGAYLELKPPTAPTPKGPITEKDFFNKFGFTFASFGELSPDMQNYVRGLPVITDKDYFAKYGVTKSEFSELDQNTQKFMMGLPVLTDKDYMSKYGMPKADFLALPTETKNRLARVAPDRKTVVVDGQVIDITEGTTPVAIYGDKDVKTITLDGEVLNITDPKNVTVMYGDKNRDIRIVKGQLVEVPEDGGTPVPIFGERTPATGMFENMILASGKSVIVKKVGSTLYNTDGDIIDLASDTYKDAVIVSKDTAFSASKTATKQARAQAEIARLDRAEGDDRLSGQLRGQDDVISKRVEALGGSLSPNIEAVSFDALKAARKGVGFYNKIKQGISEAGGALIPAFENLFADEVAAGNYIDTINVLARVGLANSPKYAEGEQTRLAQLFPSTDRLLTNPENAVRKLVGLKKVMRFEYRQNLNVLANSTDSVLIRQAEQSNYAIESVLKMLETIPDRGVLSDASVDATIDALRQARGQ